MLSQRLSPLSSPVPTEQARDCPFDDAALLGNAELVDRFGLRSDVDPSSVGDLLGLDDAEGPGEPVPAGGSVPPELVAWVDQHAPPGVGVALTGAVNMGVGALSVDAEGGITVTNQGGGWLEVEAEGLADGGPSVGIGGMVIKTGAVASATGGVGGRVERTFRVPWTRLADLTTLATLAGTVVGGELAGNAVEAVPLFDTLLAGHDLGEYLISDQIELDGFVNGNAEAGAVGEQLGLDATLSGSVSFSVDYDDLADTTGRRTGTYRVAGEAEGLIEALGHLEESLGVDLSGVVADATGSVAVVVPFTEVDGDKTCGLPYLEVSAGGGSGATSVGASAEVGPDHQALILTLGVTRDQPLWDEVDRTVAEIATAVTTGILRMDGSSEVTATLELSPENLPEGSTGVQPPSLAASLDLAEQCAAAADLEIAVDATLLSVDAEGQLTGDFVGELSGEADGTAAVVFRRDDVVPDLDHPPTVQDVIALMRAGSSLLDHPTKPV